MAGTVAPVLNQILIPTWRPLTIPASQLIRLVVIRGALSITAFSGGGNLSVCHLFMYATFKNGQYILRI